MRRLLFALLVTAMFSFGAIKTADQAQAWMVQYHDDLANKLGVAAVAPE